MRKLLMIPALLVATGCSQATDEGTFETTSEPLAADGVDGDAPAPPPEGRFERRFEHRFERLAERLGLDEAQAEAVRPILRSAHERRMALRDLEPEARHEAAEALHAEVRAELARILTEEQLAELGSVMGPHRGRHPMGPPLHDLDLTDEQRAAVEPIFERTRERHMALRDLEPEARREAAEALHAEVRAELAQILTEEQLARLDARHERRRGRHGRGRRFGPGPGDGFGPGPGDGFGPGPGDGFGPGPGPDFEADEPL